MQFKIVIKKKKGYEENKAEEGDWETMTRVGANSPLNGQGRPLSAET